MNLDRRNVADNSSFVCRRQTRRAAFLARLKSEDTIAVVGATGGCGRAIVETLLESTKFHVRAVSRSRSKARDYFSRYKEQKLTFAEADVAAGSAEAERNLSNALKGAAAVVIATGTSAFPSASWGMFFSNSPNAIDAKGTERILDLADKKALKRVILITSIGVTRRKQFPFAILNLFGVLDAKRKAEDYVMSSAGGGAFDYTIVRPGQLLNDYDRRARQNTVGSTAEECALRVQRGDVLQGQVYRRSVAYFVQCALTRPSESNLEVCLTNERGRKQDEKEVHEILDKIVTS